MTPLSNVLDLLIILCVHFGKILHVFRKLVERENRRSFANRNARATINALGRAYKKLRCFSKLRFVLARVNAVHRTNVDALLIFCAIACYYISHSIRPLRQIQDRRTGATQPLKGLSPPPLVPVFCNAGIIAEQVWHQSVWPHSLILSNLATRRGIGESKAAGSGPARRGRLGQKTDRGGKGIPSSRGMACPPLKIQMAEGKWLMLVLS